jgi:hypothetical protein
MGREVIETGNIDAPNREVIETGNIDVPNSWK